MTRSHAFLAFVALAILRVAVGYHFFKEGQAKLESGTFTAEYFLSGANGPLAPKFKSMLDDPDGMIALCAKEVSSEDGGERYQLDPISTFEAWDQYVDKASRYYDFGSEGLERELASRREELGVRIRTARAEKDASVDTRALEIQREDDARAIKIIRDQSERVDEILTDHKDMLANWLQRNDTEIIAHFATMERLEGFEQDGINRRKVGTYVESLRGQIDTIESDRNKKLKGWKKEIADLWSSLERQVNDLAVADQAEQSELPLERIYAPSDSNLSWINRIIPWFDVIVGSLLILGLFSRLASLAAAGFLLSVLATQPFWIPGSNPTYLYMIEFAALLVIFATCAGRNFGLDYFIHSIFGRKKTDPSAKAGA